MMKFEVIDSNGNIAMQCEEDSCVPNDKQIALMAKAGFKFKLDGKIISRKKIQEVLDND